MKQLLIIVFFTASLLSCRQNDQQLTRMENRIKELKKEISNVYKPGLGETMGVIQIHHAKLWFAGKNENWKLADFEMHEIREGFEHVEKFQADRKEVDMISMIDPAMDSVDKAIEEHNLSGFKNHYKLLTITCNSCHEITKYEFIQIKVPDLTPVGNQVFHH